MATATCKFNITNKAPLGIDDQDIVTYVGTITFAAVSTDTYVTGGLLALSGFAALNLGPYADRTPIAVQIASLAGSGFQYLYNVATKKLMIFGGGGSATAPAELTNATQLGATTPSIFTDVVAFELVFSKGTQ